MGEWVELTSRNDRAKVWVNLGGVQAIIKEAGGSKVLFEGRELHVVEAPEVIMTRRLDALRGPTSSTAD